MIHTVYLKDENETPINRGDWIEVIRFGRHVATGQVKTFIYRPDEEESFVLLEHGGWCRTHDLRWYGRKIPDEEIMLWKLSN